jgi:hypothetical protein
MEVDRKTIPRRTRSEAEEYNQGEEQSQLGFNALTSFRATSYGGDMGRRTGKAFVTSIKEPQNVVRNISPTRSYAGGL